MSHWLLEVLGDTRVEALKQASHIQVTREFQGIPVDEDIALIQRVAETLEMVVLDLTLAKTTKDEINLNELRTCAADAFRLMRVLPRSPGVISLETATFLLRASALAVLGDMGG